MMGLLDQATDDPNTAGLLSMGLRLMSTPGKFSTAFGQSGLGAMDDVQKLKMQLQERKNAQQRAEFMQMQMDQQRRQQEQQARAQQQQEEFRAMIQSPLGAANAQAAQAGPLGSVAAAAAQPRVNPQDTLMFDAMQKGQLSPLDYIKLQQKDETPLLVPKDTVALNRKTMQPLFSNVQPDKPEATPSDLRTYQLLGGDEKYGPGGFDKWDAARRTAGATKLTLEQRQPGAFSTAQGTEFSGMMGGINKASFAAPTQLRKLERLEALLTGVDGGKFSPAGLEVASAANSFGIKIDPKLGNKQAAQALAIDMANSMRVPSTGVMTDKDFDNFLRQIPDLSKSAEGRAQITSTMRAALKRDIEMGNLARAYVKKHGQLDNGFLDEAAQFMAANPVVSGMSEQSPGDGQTYVRDANGQLVLKGQ